MGEEERELVVDRAAEEELTAAALTLASVEATLDLARRFPKMGSLKPAGGKRGREVRRLRVEGFPFSLVYRELPKGIYLIAVAHDKRRPDYWKNR